MKTAIITSIFALTVTTYAAEFHVATNGKDSNPGTPADTLLVLPSFNPFEAI
jgi:hypothetical protein